MTVQFPSSPRDCRQMESLLPPFVDGEATPRDAALVEAHLSGCAACRRLAQEQRDGRALLTSRRASLCGPAPAGLESRVRHLAGVDVRAAWWQRLTPLAAAAALVLAVSGAFYWGTGQSSVLLAAQLTLDHLKCFVIDGAEHDHPMTAAAAQVEFHDAFGMDVRLPEPPAGSHAKLVSVRQCLYGEGWIAHALYRVDGEPVSLFVLRGEPASPADVEAFGRHAEVISRGETTYVVVAPARLTGVAGAVGLEAE
jgi:anti-sigma factor RsiW